MPPALSTATRWASPAVLVLGAVAVAVLVGGLNASSAWLPAVLGVATLAAGIVGRRAATAVAGSTLLGFGLAVLAVRVGPLPDGREAPAVVVGLGAGIGVAALLAARLGRPADVAVASLTMLGLGIAFWFAFDVSWLLDWPLWSVALLVWAAAQAALAQPRASTSHRQP